MQVHRKKNKSVLVIHVLIPTFDRSKQTTVLTLEYLELIIPAQQK